MLVVRKFYIHIKKMYTFRGPEIVRLGSRFGRYEEYEYFSDTWLYTAERDPNPMAQAILENIDLNPETFEIGSSTPIDTYWTIINLLSHPGTVIIEPNTELRQKFVSYRGHGRRRTRPETPEERDKRVQVERSVSHQLHKHIPFPYPYRGWPKHELQQQIQKAIDDAGLTVEYTKPNGDRARGIPYRAIGINREGYLPGLSRTRTYYPDDNTYGDERSISDYPRRTYYESIYRRLFNTLQNIDWVKVCQGQYVDQNLLRFVAINDFGINPDRVFRWTYRHLCDALQQESGRRKQLLRELAEEAAESRLQILYQPGSPWRPVETLQYFKQEPKPEIIPGPYQDIFEACADPNTPKNLLIFFANRMDIEGLLPVDLNDISKEELCKIVTNYAKILYQR